MATAGRCSRPGRHRPVCLASPAPGDIGKATLDVRLMATGTMTGTVVMPVNCDQAQVTGSGYAARSARTCNVESVPVVKYAVEVAATGGYYAAATAGSLTVTEAQVQPELWLPLIWQGPTKGSAAPEQHTR